MSCHSGIEATPAAPDEVVLRAQEVPGASRACYDLDGLGDARIEAQPRPFLTPFAVPLPLVTGDRSTFVAAPAACGKQVPKPVPLMASRFR